MAEGASERRATERSEDAPDASRARARAYAGAFAVASAGVVLLNRPFVDLFDTGGTIGGAPATVAYIFGAWLLLIGALAWMTRLRARAGPPAAQRE